jgi:hypothetical protein
VIKLHAGWTGVICLALAGIGCFAPWFAVGFLATVGLVLYNGYAFGRIK